MTSQIFWGKVIHERFLPQTHSFRYPFFMVAFELSELEKSTRLASIRHNKWGLFSIHDKDYLSESSGSIKEKLYEELARNGVSETPTESYLLTVPSLLGYVFNPVNFYICYRVGGSVLCVVAEVNNTFGEKHVYIMKPGEDGAHFPLTFSFPKAFYVSPFFDVSGSYQLTVKSFKPLLEVYIDLKKESERLLSVALAAEAKELTSTMMLKTFLKFPFVQLLTMTQIHFQAMRLSFEKSVRAFKKPAPSSVQTIRSNQSWIHRLRLLLLSKLKQF